MRTRSMLAAGAALTVFVMVGADAQAKTAHHHASAPSKETVELKQEVEALKAEVQALESRLDSQNQAQQQAQAQAQTRIQAAQTAAQAAQAQAQTAQSAAQAAQTQAKADETQIQKLPKAIETAAKNPKGGWWDNGWWGNTRVSGVVFADVSNITNKNANGKTAQSGTDYDIKRTYLTVEHKFNNTYSFNFTSDLTFDGNSTSPSGAGSPTPNEAGGANTVSGVKSTQLFVKKAYLQAHYSDAFNVRLGAAELPWVPFVESLNGYRYVEQMLIDRTKFGTTTDWGVHAFGSFGNGLIGYAVSVVDGEGFKQPALGTVNRTNAMDVEGRINVTYDHVTLAVGGYDGKLGLDVQNVPTYHTAERFDALAAYTDSHIKLGFEYMWAKYWNKDITQVDPTKTNSSEAYSVFASYNFTPAISLFGRYDYVKPKDTTVPTENENFFDVGVSYKPISAIDFAVVYKRDSVTNGSFSTSDGVIGIPTGATTGKGNYDEIGLFTQVKF